MKPLLIILLFAFLPGQAINSYAQGIDTNQQQSLRDLVENVKRPGFLPQDLFLFERKYYDEGMKKRLLEVLANHWTTEELEAWVQSDLSKPFTKERVERDARRVAEAGKMPYEKVVDSLKAVRIAQVRKQLEAKPVNPEIILAVAWLDLQEAVPTLKQALHDKTHYDSATVHLALARLQVEPYHKAALQRYSVPVKSRYYSVDSLRDYGIRSSCLLFICSQESVYKVSRWLYSKAKVNAFSDGDDLVPLANYPTRDLLRIVMNSDFRKGLNPEILLRGASFVQITKEEMVFARNWIEANQGKFQLNRDFFSDPDIRR